MATCADTDWLHEGDNPQTVTLNVSDKTYDGSAVSGTVTASGTGLDLSGITISYFDASDNPLDAAPSAVGSYKAKITLGTVTAEKSFSITAPADPGGGSSSGSSSSSSSTSSRNLPSVNTVSSGSNSSSSVVTDKNGNAVKNALVTVAVRDSKTGKTVTKEVLTDESGQIATNEIVAVKRTVSADGKSTSENKNYLANSDGTIYRKQGFADVAMGDRLNRSEINSSSKVVYVNGEGSLKQGEKFSVVNKSGKSVQYAVGNDCNLIRNGFFNSKKTGETEKSIKSGATYFAGSNGKILTNTLFTVKPAKSGKVKVKVNSKGAKAAVFLMDEEQACEIFDFKKGGLEDASGKGEQYYATKSGKIAKDKWVNVGLKEYYCSSNGKITKSR